MRAAFVWGFLLVGLLVPADVAQAQDRTSLPGAVFVQRVEHPPDLWRRIYREVEVCVGHKGKFEAVRWYVTAQPWTNQRGDTTYGMWHRSGDKPIIIVAHDRYLLDELPTQVIEVGAGHAVRYLGNYEDYVRAKENAAAQPPPPSGRRRAS